MSVMTAEMILERLRQELPAVDHHHEEIIDIGDTHLTMRLPLRPEYISWDLPPGSGQAVFSAPVMMGFADTAMYAAVHAFGNRNKTVDRPVPVAALGTIRATARFAADRLKKWHFIAN